MKRLGMTLVICFVSIVTAFAQPGRDWMADNSDAQRSAWVRSDAKISKESISGQLTDMVRQEEESQRIYRAGFERVTWRNLSGGIVAIHSGWRL